jgi:hypothetical protein
MGIRLTINELNDAVAWAREHIAFKHNGELLYANLSIRGFPAGGIGQRTVITCEICDSVVGRAGHSDHNYDVTDYDSW